MAEKDERYYQAYLTHNHISRRGLFRGIFGGAEKAQQASNARLAARPPYAASEDLFLHFCDGCGKCASHCPYGLIFVQQGKAELMIDYSACDFCGLCAENCPTNALNKAFKADTNLRPTFTSSCLQHKKQSCQTCQQACPQLAISSDLHIDNEKCNGCGECKISCFMNAVELSLAK